MPLKTNQPSPNECRFNITSTSAYYDNVNLVFILMKGDKSNFRKGYWGSDVVRPEYIIDVDHVDFGKNFRHGEDDNVFVTDLSIEDATKELERIGLTKDITIDCLSWTYRPLLKPNECKFGAYKNYDDEVEIFISDFQRDDDDIREIDHPQFNLLWDNTCENTWVPTSRRGSSVYHIKTVKDARNWGLAIGMTYDKSLENEEG